MENSNSRLAVLALSGAIRDNFDQQKSPTVRLGCFVGGAAGYCTRVRTVTDYSSTSLVGSKLRTLPREGQK